MEVDESMHSAAPLPLATELSSPIDENHGSADLPPKSQTVLGTSKRKRQQPKATGASTIKRSISTPNVRSLASGDSAPPLSAADKKRNKLGYHRTSVACGHCRRRKIRCLPSADDTQGRCSNCIRLKKECNFFPVDQQPMVERKPRSHSRTEQIPNKASTSSTSSPILVDQNVSDQGQDHQQYVPLTTSPGQGFPGSGDPLMGAATLPSSKESTLRSSLSSLQSFDRNTLWDNSSFISQSPSSDLTAHPSSEDLSRSVWSFAEPHLAVGYPPFSNPPSTMTRSSGGNGLPLGASGENTAWGPSTHPTSVATMDELPSNYHDRVTQSFHASNPYRNRVSTDVYTPSLHASNHSSSTTNSEYRPTSTSGSIIQDQAGAFDFPPSWVPVLGPQNDCIPGKEADSMSVWYSEPSQLQQVDEEQLNYPYSGDAPQYYSSASQYP